MPTTYIKTKDKMKSEDLNHCHNGIGALQWIEVLDTNDPGGNRLNFMHDNIMPPNTTIGIHSHSDDQEYYYILSGSGVMTLDGKEYEVNSGDITAVFPGGEHGLENRSDEDLRLLVFSLKVE